MNPIQILLYGPRKAGTTLFQRLIDGGNEIFVHPGETKIKKFLKFKKKFGTSASLNPGGLSDRERQSFFRGARKGWENFNDHHYFQAISDRADEIHTLRDYIDTDIEAASRGFGHSSGEYKGWAIKEISGHTSTILRSFMDAYPEGKVILIYRDPRYIARAVFREKKRTGTKVDFKKTLQVVREPYKIFNQLESFTDKSRFLRVHYENYTQYPEKAMRQVSEFLNIPFDEKFLKPTIHGKLCRVPSASKKKAGIFKSNTTLSDDITLLQFSMIVLYSFLKRLALKKIRSDRQKLIIE